MGGMSFWHKIESDSPINGFNALVDEATHQHGVDAYNGTINTTSLIKRPFKVFKKWNEKNFDIFLNKIQEKNNVSKWETMYADLGVKEYHVITFKAKPTNAKPSYKLKYVIFENGNMVLKEDTITKAKTKMMKLAIAKPLNNYKIKKMYVEENEKFNSNVVATLEKEIKKYKTRPKRTLKENQKLVEIHEYGYYGWASC